MVQRPSKVWISIKAQGLINTVQAIIVDDQDQHRFEMVAQEESGV